MTSLNSTSNSNALIVGCGSKFGQTLSIILENRGFTVYGISSNTKSDTVLNVDWQKCFIPDFEKFLRNLPNLELVIFNQNSPSLTEQYWKLNSAHILDVWKQSKKWHQSYYVNCILPTHIIQSLADTDKINEGAKIVWMLSKKMLSNYKTNLDYLGQKYQNYKIMQQFAKTNPHTFVGICPGALNSDIYHSTATSMIDLLMQPDLSQHSGQFFAFDNIYNNFYTVRDKQ